MKKTVAVLLALILAFSLVSCGRQNNNDNNAGNDTYNANNTNDESPEPVADADYVIRIYSDSNTPEKTKWLAEKAVKAGFKVSIDDNTVISIDAQAIQQAAEKQDGDILFGFNEMRWIQLLKGAYEGISLLEWSPSWAGKVGAYSFGGKAYGLSLHSVVMIYRTDKKGTNGEEIKLQHWADIADSGYTWYRQGRVGGTTNVNINNSILYPFADPSSPAGGISVEGWKALWRYCAEGIYTGDPYGFDPLNRGEVQVSAFPASRLGERIASAADGSKDPIAADNWMPVDIADGMFCTAEYIGVLDRADRSEGQTLQVLAFAEWLGSAEVQTEWAREFGVYPCNKDASGEQYEGSAEVYAAGNMALHKVPGTDMIYAEYAGEHSAEWTNILVNLGYYWSDPEKAPKEPDWDQLDWSELVQKK